MNKMKKLIVLILVGLILQSCGRQTSVKNLVKGLPQTSVDIKLPDNNNLTTGEDKDDKKLPEYKGWRYNNNNNIFFGTIIAVPVVLITAIAAVSYYRCCRPLKDNKSSTAPEAQPQQPVINQEK